MKVTKYHIGSSALGTEKPSYLSDDQKDMGVYCLPTETLLKQFFEILEFCFSNYCVLFRTQLQKSTIPFFRS